ncbi:MAG: hypothetical protein LBU51_01060 [Bacteroidales bacterium]|nr:hypothetical protein [Bacteroidales bacterium]
MNIIGIRDEDKYTAERRVAITPENAKKLIDGKNCLIYFTPSSKRVFDNTTYQNAGCLPSETLTEANIIIGVKEIPISFFEKNKTYIFFSHTIKGQSYNMDMLKTMMKLNCSLIDYEKIVDDQNRRLIFFGRFAGLAGAINSLWSLRLKFEEEGVKTSLSFIKQTCTYNSLDEAKKMVVKVGNQIKQEGFPAKLGPLIIGITGYGNVSKGAQEIYDLLPIKEISPSELLSYPIDSFDLKTVYKVVFKEEDLYKRKDNSPFSLEHFYQNGNLYESQFEKYINNLTLLTNCMYWNDNYDKIVTKKFLKENWKKNNFRLKVIGDITCDPNGSIEATHIGTNIEDPIFVYHPETEQPTFGHHGEGILIMAVDILPSELPLDASIAFSSAFHDFLPEIVECDFNLSTDKLPLSDPIKKALILHKGKLTKEFEYITKYL